MKDSVVYVVQDPDGKELFPATKFGDLRVILSGKEDISTAIHKLRKGLERIRPNDYLLPIGKPVNIGIATFFALTHLMGAPLKVLAWKRETYNYSEETINPYESTATVPGSASKSADAAANH